MLCNACHTVPTTQIHKTGAATTGTVALANLSVTGGIATASYSTTALTCSNTYCHGNLGGGVGATNVTPAWTTAATLVCASCHGMPPSATSTGRSHPNRTDCGSCHTGYTGVDRQRRDPRERRHRVHHPDLHHLPRQIRPAPAPTPTSSPSRRLPRSTRPTLSTGAKVGAHAKHLFTGAAGGPSFSKQVACSECHNAAIPATPLHANGLPNVAFGTLAAGPGPPSRRRPTRAAPAPTPTATATSRTAPAPAPSAGPPRP